MSVDPITMQSILRTIPEVNKRRKQAELLRSVAGGFGQIAQRPGTGNMLPAQQGGWFPTVQKWRPDYAAAGNQIVGSLGQYLSGREADKAEAELGDIVGGQSVQAMQQASGGTGDDPTPAALRAYLTSIGGADAKTMLGTIPRVQSTKVLDNGNIGTVMSDGSVIDTGERADAKVQIMKTGDGRIVGIGTSGAYRNKAQEVFEQVMQNMSTVSPEGGEPFRVEEGIDPAQIEALMRVSMGIPEGQPVPGFTTAPAAPVATERPLRVPTAAEEARAEAIAKAQGEASVAPLIASTQGQIDLAKGQAKNIAEAQAGLGAVESTTSAGIDAIDRLIAHPGLDAIVGGGLWGRLPDKITALGLPIFQAGSPAAGALAEYQHLMGANFLQSFQQLKGGGQITEIEGAKAEQALARLNRAQKKEDVVKALNELKGIMEGIRENARRKASGAAPDAAVPAATARPALPAGFEWGD